MKNIFAGIMTATMLCCGTIYAQSEEPASNSECHETPLGTYNICDIASLPNLNGCWSSKTEVLGKACMQSDRDGKSMIFYRERDSEGKSAEGNGKWIKISQEEAGLSARVDRGAAWVSSVREAVGFHRVDCWRQYSENTEICLQYVGGKGTGLSFRGPETNQGWLGITSNTLASSYHLIIMNSGELIDTQNRQPYTLHLNYAVSKVREIVKAELASGAKAGPSQSARVIDREAIGSWVFSRVNCWSQRVSAPCNN